jgi:hypothetical protein
MPPGKMLALLRSKADHVMRIGLQVRAGASANAAPSQCIQNKRRSWLTPVCSRCTTGQGPGQPQRRSLHQTAGLHGFRPGQPAVSVPPAHGSHAAAALAALATANRRCHTLVRLPKATFAPSAQADMSPPGERLPPGGRLPPRREQGASLAGHPPPPAVAPVHGLTAEEAAERLKRDSKFWLVLGLSHLRVWQRAPNAQQWEEGLAHCLKASSEAFVQVGVVRWVVR